MGSVCGIIASILKNASVLCLVYQVASVGCYFGYLYHNSRVGQNLDEKKFFLWQKAFFVEAQPGFLQKMLLHGNFLCYNDTDIKELSILILNSSFETQEDDHG